MPPSGPPAASLVPGSKRRLHAAAAELALDALPTLAPAAPVLVVGAPARAGELGEPLCDALRARALAPVLLGGDGPGSVKGRLAALPFRPACFDAALGHLLLAGRDEDRGALDALSAAVTPGGWLVLTALLEGSFEEVFDLLTEVSEQEGLPRLRAAVNDARRGLKGGDALKALLQERGLEVDAYGEEQRALWFAGGAQAVADPLLWDGLLGGWLGEEARSPRLREALCRFIDAYFPDGRFPVRVQTAVVRARARRDG